MANQTDIFNTRNTDEAFLVFIRCIAAWKLNEYANFLSQMQKTTAKKSLIYPNKTIYAKVIVDMVVLITFLCLEEKNTDVYCVFK